jgi:5-(carboxyamino)imidazole ribonucleotide synthase
MEQLVTSEFKLGIIAGGQLGKMLALAASNWDVKTYILDSDEHCPASTVCTHFVKGDRLNFEDVYNFGSMVDMITFEMEDINTEALKKLELEGKKINPSPKSLEIIQDKGQQKLQFQKNEIPTSKFILVDNLGELKHKIETQEIKFPFVQKLRKGGYDGKGVVVINSMNELNNLLDGPSVIEDKVDIDKEISVKVARNANGDIKCFPVVEMEFNHEANLVENLLCPSSIKESLINKAKSIAKTVIESFDIQGILAVEMFVDEDENLWVNEIAPRPHNSGHHTIESVITSQYEQQLRAIFNFPLGSTSLKMPSVMINLLGEPGIEGPVKYEGLTESMGIEGVKIHLYGKKLTKPFRKMGHVTVLAPSIKEAKEKADLVKQKLKVTSWQNQ